MFRVSNLIKSSIENIKERSLNGSIAIWNMTNRCNLSCLHCYSKAELGGKDALSLDEILQTLESLSKSGVKFLIISGGEPLVRQDIFNIASACKELGIVTSLSTNGLYVHHSNVEKIVEMFDYVGVSIDGSEDTHDRFRVLEGSFGMAKGALELLLERSRRVGVRFTLTKETIKDLPFIFELAEEMKIPKIYISHLVYSGRGLENASIDISPKERFEAVDFIISKAFEYYENSTPIEIVTGNMEMDSILLSKRFSQKYPKYHENLIDRLKAWGGNSAGKKLVNIDYNGNVKPDPFSHIILGNIKQTPFDTIWKNSQDEMLNFLREHPRQLEGRCQSCDYISMCNGGSRARSWAVYENIRATDPSCYMDEILETEKN